MADAVFQHFDNILGTAEHQLTWIDFNVLDLSNVNGASLDHCFTEQEIWEAIADMPTDKAPGPDGFTGMFYRTA